MSKHDRTLVHDERGIPEHYDAEERKALAQCARERGYEVGARVEVLWRLKWRGALVNSVSVWRGYTTSVTVVIDGVKGPFTTNTGKVRVHQAPATQTSEAARPRKAPRSAA